MYKVLRKAIEHLDITLAGLGCFFSIPLIIYLQISVQRPIFTAIGVICLVSFSIYLLLRLTFGDRLTLRTTAQTHTRLLLNILFFSFLCYIVLTLYFRPELYVRPIGYFIAMAAIIAVLATEILFFPSGKHSTCFLLFKIILTGLIAALSAEWIFPSLVGVDPWWHEWATNHIIASEHVAGIGKYTMMPAFHLMTSTTSLVTGSDYKYATMLSVSSLQVICNILFVFLIGELIHSTKAGLLAALLFSVASVAIHFGFWTIPTSMGVIFIAMSLYLLLNLRKEKPGASILLAVLSMITLLLTNPVPIVFMLVTLPLLWLGFKIYKWLHYQNAYSCKFFIIFTLVFAVVTLTWFTFGTGHIRPLVRSITSGFGIESRRPLTLPGENIYIDMSTPPLPEEDISLTADIMQYGVKAPFGELLFNYLGLFLFFAMSFIGVLFMLSKKNRNAYGFAFLFMSMMLLAINFFGTIFDLRLLTQRWMYYLQFLTAVPLGITLLWMGYLTENKLISAFLASGLAFILAFLMIMSTQANLDNRTFSAHKLGNNPITASELQAVTTISKVWSGTFSTDRDIRHMARSSQLTIQVEDISAQFYSGNYKNLDNTLVLIRQRIVLQPFKSRFGVISLTHDPYSRLKQQGFSHIYNCGSVSAYVK